MRVVVGKRPAAPDWGRDHARSLPLLIALAIAITTQARADQVIAFTQFAASSSGCAETIRLLPSPAPSCDGSGWASHSAKSDGQFVLEDRANGGSLTEGQRARSAADFEVFTPIPTARRVDIGLEVAIETLATQAQSCPWIAVATCSDAHTRGYAGTSNAMFGCADGTPVQTNATGEDLPASAPQGTYRMEFHFSCVTGASLRSMSYGASLSVISDAQSFGGSAEARARGQLKRITFRWSA